MSRTTLGRCSATTLQEGIVRPAKEQRMHRRRISLCSVGPQSSLAFMLICYVCLCFPLDAACGGMVSLCAEIVRLYCSPQVWCPMQMWMCLACLPAPPEDPAPPCCMYPAAPDLPTTPHICVMSPLLRDCDILSSLPASLSVPKVPSLCTYHASGPSSRAGARARASIIRWHSFHRDSQLPNSVPNVPLIISIHFTSLLNTRTAFCFVTSSVIQQVIALRLTVHFFCINLNATTVNRRHHFSVGRSHFHAYLTPVK